MTQPDIEIYLLSCKTESILNWLNSRFTVINEPKQNAKSTYVTVQHKSHEIKVVILEEAAGKKFTSVWFDSSHTPWENDVECAKEVFLSLNCEVRCIHSGWSEEDNPDDWWVINNFKEGPFIWK